MRTLFPLLIAGLAVPALAQDSYTLDPSHTIASFEIRHHGVSLQRGLFPRGQGRAVLDPVGGGGRIEVSFDANAVVTGVEALDRVLRGPNFFNTAVHPRIRFVADAIRYADGKPVEATGQLTLLGVSRPVTLEVRDFTCTTHFLRRIPLCGAEVRTTLRRSDFGMNFGLPHLIGDEVRLAIQVEGLRDF
ncbi:MAG: YceI family protein [Thiobacillaceae bacterium]|nr:YceI family protein [Thiobacillaceae bacterium]MCX7673399.1 YceI family protein [Thiobacillaceae bacterium]MDW8323163.1 YceI family protein [Burkholderiales bacterium]